MENFDGRIKSGMLIGEFHHIIDVKGRIMVPSKFREALGENFVASKGLDGCISLYSYAGWEAFQNEILSERNEYSRRLNRSLFSSAEIVNLDTQGRVLIPPKFRQYAGLVKEVVLIGVSERAEIWDKNKWIEYNDEPGFDLSEIMRERGF